MTRGARRLPDFLVIGAMKAGTTSAFRWLGEHPDVSLPATKEPNYFSHAAVWARGLPWYSNLFEGIAHDQCTGEFSVSYTSPDACDLAADRISEVLPKVKLIYLVREPEERLRSHYLHEVQRGRERRPFLDAIDSASPYLAQSEYFRCIKPYVERFPPSALLLVGLSSLQNGGPGWRSILDHLSLEYVPPGAPQNDTASKAQFTRPMLWLFDHGMGRLVSRAPAAVRGLGRGVLLQPLSENPLVAEGQQTPLPAWATERLEADAQRLQALFPDSAFW